MSRSSRLESENKRLSMEVETMKEACSRASSQSVKYKMQLEEEKNFKEELMEGNAKLKKKVNDLAAICHQQNEKIKILENNLIRSTSARASRVKVIGSITDIIETADPTKSQQYIDLQTKYDELQIEHREALDIIDELEFELGDIDHLEIEIQRLQQENVELREVLQANGYSENLESVGQMSYGVDDSGSGMKAFTAMKIADDDEEEQQQEEETDGFINELKTIHNRKIMMQQRLENFHSRQSINLGREKE
ncbi:hypothetical protein PVAND_006477 [Polypedilum vanderplanki]|uniref:Uncharacterized protein n=1 Tax=Polypedilum vanderplanki TaxID=319348 RepID=A0A9J6C4A7_POLVA|nr:hypothetical protein PVAND_006477 [Polypedilum vanderplanki]